MKTHNDDCTCSQCMEKESWEAECRFCGLPESDCVCGFEKYEEEFKEEQKQQVE